MTIRKTFLSLFLLLFIAAPFSLQAEDGYRAWLRYDKIDNAEVLKSYQAQFNHVLIKGDSPTLKAAQEELEIGLKGLMGTEFDFTAGSVQGGTLLIGTIKELSDFSELNLKTLLSDSGPEGYIIQRRELDGKEITLIAANTDIGVLYGVYHLLRMMQTHQYLDGVSVSSSPKIENRILNHWDNLNRLVERGYAGLSLWDWGRLPEYKDPRYTDYARLNASMGINGTVLNNVNADPRILNEDFLEKVEVLADIFRPYGIKVYLSVNFQSPIEVGGLETADPLAPEVQEWWNEKAADIYERIPDFGGFLVKADSEGQPGPFQYNRTHAEGANMLADAVAPQDGLLIWRAFVYSPEQTDRFREAYDEFVPQDGKFRDNVLLQVKNGPIDFQPREPFSPLFGALPNTNTVLELQITQEYFGFANHLAYQGPLFTEALNHDTYAEGEGSTVGKIVASEVFDYEHTGIAGVVNLGTDRNWTGHPFIQSSWYAFGRLAWDYTLSSEDIAKEWLRMTFTNNPKFVEPITEVMQESREAGVNYRSPLGLTHLYAQGHHYGPAPWTSDLPRPDWTAVYYHKAAEDGIGFDRTETGSNAIGQYEAPLEEKFSDPETTPEEFLLWFHHLPWDYEMDSGRTLWGELVHKYYQGVETVRWMQEEWESIEGLIDEHRFEEVKALLEIQEKDAVIWRNSCVLYFQTHSNKPIPDQYEKPEHDLEYYKELEKTRYIPAPRYY
ncbi:alpha-glucuronidase family glycosyl hydrolase [Gracilimonas mengyeensis]|uniref:Xylan alpha-1,2-glucuronidase n=1 Tax=Gracilimonas mengyeensis TaxID=1302730 RepID=A0A521B6E3_9BACT|nr:alpha-glucuronidase family glycosyl hydrolase [Gracilimonas mengyeensis]SMO42633.1 alpha-glucuronidase [Gracilimonas mengyeensis]